MKHGKKLADADCIFEELRMVAEAGNADAQCYLGHCYEEGLGVKTNRALAVKWYRKAAEQGNAGAQFNLGNCYDSGEGVEQDKAEAVRWYRKAAEQGLALAKKALERLNQGKR